MWCWGLQIMADNILYLNVTNSNQLNFNNWLNIYFLDWIAYLTHVTTQWQGYHFLLNSLVESMDGWLNNLIFQLNCLHNINIINKELLVINNNLVTKLITYNFVFTTLTIKYSCLVYIVYYIITYTYYNVSMLNNIQNSALSKILHIIDSEEELGSLDDAFTIIFLFMLVFGWFFIFSLCFTYFFNSQLIIFGIGAIILIFFILLTPLSTLLDFGISFTTYIRGASSSSNLLVECIFDIIGTLVVFTRFVVQNIRFVLIFFAYFELFEWTYNSTLWNSLIQVINLNNLTYWNNLIVGLNNTTSLVYYFSVIIVSLISYLYYLVHLLILIFVQITIYLLISFWLFFFFYTSFTLNKTEKLFLSKKLIYVCSSKFNKHQLISQLHPRLYFKFFFIWIYLNISK